MGRQAEVKRLLRDASDGIEKVRTDIRIAGGVVPAPLADCAEQVRQARDLIRDALKEAASTGKVED